MQIWSSIRERSVATAAILLSGALCFGSCVNEGDLQPHEQRVAITPSATFLPGSIEVQSRAPEDGSTQLLLHLARANESAPGTYGSYGTTTLTALRTIGNGATGLTINPTQYYPTNGLKTKMTGWYPAATTFDKGVVSWTFDGEQDIMTSTSQEGSATIPMPSLTFEHRLAQLQFFPYADNAVIALSWGKVKNIEVLEQANQASYTLLNEAITFSGSTTFAAGIAANGVAIASSRATATMVGHAMMVAPQSSDSSTLTLRITTELQGVKTVTITRKLEAGIPYKIYLRFALLDVIVTP